MQVFSAFVTMQLPRNGAAGCHQVSRCDGTPRLSRPLNLLLEPSAATLRFLRSRIDFITFLPVLARLLRRALSADHRPFYSALISARVMYTHYPPWQSAEMVMITRSLISWCGLHGTSPDLLARERVVNGRCETKRRRKTRGRRRGRGHALATGRNLPRSNRDYARETQKLLQSQGTVFIIR